MVIVHSPFGLAPLLPAGMVSPTPQGWPETTTLARNRHAVVLIAPLRLWQDLCSWNGMRYNGVETSLHEYELNHSLYANIVDP